MDFDLLFHMFKIKEYISSFWFNSIVYNYLCKVIFIIVIIIIIFTELWAL